MINKIRYDRTICAVNKIIKAFKSRNPQYLQKYIRNLKKLIYDQDESIKDLQKSIEDGIICPITKNTIKEPVINIVDGILYEKEHINTWLVKNKSSPITREQTNHSDLKFLKDLKKDKKFEEIECPCCTKVFEISSYSSREGMFRALCQHCDHVH